MINGRLFVVITFLSRHLPSCSGAFYLWMVWHISLFLSSSSLQNKARVWGVDVLVCEDSRYLLKYWFVKAIPSCGGDHLHRHVQELHASTTSLILDFGCIFFLFLFSLVLSSLSKCNVIAFTLHLRGGVKGKIVISYSRVSLPHLSLMYSIYTPLGLNPNHPFPLYSFITHTCMWSWV